MLKFLSKVRIEFNALDPHIASCMEFLSPVQCSQSRRIKSSVSALGQALHRRSPAPNLRYFRQRCGRIFPTSTPAQAIRNMILEKDQML
ncbi:hypothetical protein DITRI_Ditri03aG0096600 [Diplodiscus trichospermus]